MQHHQGGGSSSSHNPASSAQLQHHPGSVLPAPPLRASSAHHHPGGTTVEDSQQQTTARSAVSDGVMSSQTDHPAAPQLELTGGSYVEGGAVDVQLAEDRKRQGSAYSNASSHEEYVHVTSADGAEEVGNFTSC